jgi:translation initiation factor IF-1
MPQETHYILILIITQLMLLRETVTVYCENHAERTNALCGQNAEV